MISFKLKNASPVKEYDDIDLARGSNVEPNMSMDFYPRDRRYSEQGHIGPSDIIIDKDRYTFSYYDVSFQSSILHL
jgi:hypothetical protein